MLPKLLVAAAAAAACLVPRASMAAAPTSASASSGWVAPAFYKGLDGPKFTVLKTLPDGIELRKYAPSTWVTTAAEGADRDGAMRGSFMKLFDFISGSNDKSAKIAMTAPVLTKITPGQGPTCASKFQMGFYLSSSAAPAPKASDVKITQLPAMEVWVLPYSGYSTSAVEKAKAAELAGKLTAAKVAFDASGPWFVAGYDSPMQPTNRRNEVMLPATAPAAAATTAAAAAKKP